MHRRRRTLVSRRRGWAVLLLHAALLVALLARGHVLQTFGIALACEHDEPHAASVSSDADSNGDDSSSHSDCPPNCSRCPCGQIPLVMPDPAPSPMGALVSRDLTPDGPREAPGRSFRFRVDRPPRA
jgi:hypothetical protein